MNPERVAEGPEGLEDAQAYREALEEWERDGWATVPLEALRRELGAHRARADRCGSPGRGS